MVGGGLILTDSGNVYVIFWETNDVLLENLIRPPTMKLIYLRD